MQNRIFSVDSPKAVKAQAYGYLNAIHYLAPVDLAGQGNLCPHASPGCSALCLGWFSGQASMVADLDKGTNSVRRSRIDKTIRFMHQRAEYLLDMVNAIDQLRARAKRDGQRLCVRLNGSSDIGWEGIRFAIWRARRGGVKRAWAVKLGMTYTGAANIFEHFPDVVFVDYTKSRERALRHAAGHRPANYHLTFSRSETNEVAAREVLAAGGNVAVVFASDKPAAFYGRPVIDGDAHDLRHLDPRGGVIVGLSPKGRRAQRDTTGFVVR